MKRNILFTIFIALLFTLSCNTSSNNEPKTEDEIMDKKVDDLIKSDEAKIDSFKKANGLE